MILFCDTSALVKLYINEQHGDQMRGAVAEADAVAACRIAWAEAVAALARRAREVRADRPVTDAAKAALAIDWPHYLVLEVTQALVERAGDYADTFALRAYDSVQLAAASETARISQSEVQFACYDARLNRAAEVLGMSLLADT